MLSSDRTMKGKGNLNKSKSGSTLNLKDRKAIAKSNFVQMKASLSDRDILGLKAMPYASFLKSAYWKILKEYILTHVDNRCALCNEYNEKMIEIHHRTYKYKGEEYKNIKRSLTILCHSCHSLFHANSKISVDV